MTVLDLGEYRARQSGRIICWDCGYEQYSIKTDNMDPCENCGSTSVEFEAMTESNNV